MSSKISNKTIVKKINGCHTAMLENLLALMYIELPPLYDATSLPCMSTTIASDHEPTDAIPSELPSASRQSSPIDKTSDHKLLGSPDTPKTDENDDNLITPLHINNFDIPETLPARDGLLFPVYRRLQLAIQLMIEEASPNERINIIDDLLLMDIRLERARTRTEQRKAMWVLLPVQKSLEQEFETMGFTELKRNLERLLLMLGPMISRMPLQLENRIYACLRFPAHQNLVVKISMNHSDSPSCAIDKVIAALTRHRTKQSADIPAEEIIATLARTLGHGPPYIVLSLTPPRWLRNSINDETALNEKDIVEEESSQQNDSAFDFFLRKTWQVEKEEQVCSDCWRVRKDIQEDIVSALIRADLKLAERNYDMENELMFP